MTSLPPFRTVVDLTDVVAPDDLSYAGIGTLVAVYSEMGAPFTGAEFNADIWGAKVNETRTYLFDFD